jgi:hypothetical protein
VNAPPPGRVSWPVVTAPVLWAACFGCGRVFGSNPLRVPSYQREPLCPGCLALLNEERARRGRPPLAAPADAYPPAQARGLG